MLSPCIPEAFGDCFVEMTYLGKCFEISYKKSHIGEKSVYFNDEKWDFKIDENGKIVAFFSDENFNDKNKIEIIY